MHLMVPIAWTCDRHEGSKMQLHQEREIPQGAFKDKILNNQVEMARSNLIIEDDEELLKYIGGDILR